MRGNTKSGTGEREFIASFREGDHIPLSRKRAGVKSRGVIAYFKKSDHIPHAVRGREKSSTAGEDMIATFRKGDYISYYRLRGLQTSWRELIAY